MSAAAYRSANFRRPLPRVILRERKESVWERHWLRRGNFRKVKLTRERPFCDIGDDADERQEKKALLKFKRRSGWFKEERRERWYWNRNDREESRGAIGSRLEQAAAVVGKGVQRMKRAVKGKKKYRPLPPEEDVSGWYSD